ncbi:MAG TPA: hypothetical protein ENH82_01570 [bacterium]|nr:hypothetical protein [bacterium]
MKKTKLIMTLIGTGILLIIGMYWLFTSVMDIALWGLWFGTFTALIVQYSTANVIQSNTISKNYKEGLVDK